MVKIKICGITKIDDALKLAKLNIDYLGMIFYKRSPRYIDEKKAEEISKSIFSYNLKKVGVFVNEDINTINNIIKKVKLDLVQLHGDESPEFCKKITIPVIKVFRIKTKDDLYKIEDYKKVVDFFLFDTFSKDKYGGTGVAFSWDLLKHSIVDNIKFFLSGGLTIDNFKEALFYNPYCLDFNSGVEISPGIKNIDLIKKIVMELKGK